MKNMSRLIALAAGTAMALMPLGTAMASESNLLDKQCNDGYGHISGAQTPVKTGPNEVWGMGTYENVSNYPAYVRVYKQVDWGIDTEVAYAEGLQNGEPINATGPLEGAGSYYTYVTGLSNTEVCRSSTMYLE